MKKRFSMFATLVAFSVMLCSVGALSQPKGPKVTVKGEVVDIWCYLEGGDHGDKHKECATTCAKAGNPMGIVGRQGQCVRADGNSGPPARPGGAAR